MLKQPAAQTLDEANAAIDEIERRRSEFSAALARCGTELAEAETALGEAVLGGDESAVGRVAQLRLQADGLRAALAVLDKRLGAVLLAKRRAEASDLRRQAEAKRVELADLEKKTSDLLARLSRLEGVIYDASILSAQRSGSWLLQETLRPPQPWESVSDCGPAPTNTEPFAVPKSRQLRKAIAELEREAAAIEVEIEPPIARSEAARDEVYRTESDGVRGEARLRTKLTEPLESILGHSL